MTTATTDMDPIRATIAKWYLKEIWGWDLDKMAKVEELSNSIQLETMLKSLLIAANGDGELSEAERKWVIGRGATAGAPESLLKELETYPANQDISEVVTSTPVTSKGRRAIIYIAIKAAASDAEYAEGEKATIRKMAKAIDISEEVVKEIEDLYLEEERIKQKRISLCLPEGDPYN
ncbi:MAG: DUF533 domain-containing protein [Moorea sp. SIOASIH]|uniref:DUF533 domain-containing protein n=1 Tax=Moorena sp. SIOASIH TaxID=2607817 RepID=UPI0013B60659|nr:DUF533 domain-containing protein [Moorena sp. SIOASIH]NEO42235.1 DUF533 domain-containing protein [Moorena sp. SIOASIH]